MTPVQIATLGRLSEDLETYVDSIKDNNISCQVFTDADTLAQHIGNYNTFAGFSINKDLDISHFKWIHSFGAGVDQILWNKTIAENCLITKTLGDMDRNIAEYCLTYILTDIKHVETYRKSQKTHDWYHMPVQSARGLNALIVGTGFIGRGIAKLLSENAFITHGINTSGQTVKYFNTMYSDISKVNNSSIDIIINALPLTDETSNYYDVQFFKQYENALFINVGRGESVIDNDLIQALQKGYLRKAVLDVFRNEPLPSHHPFWKNDKILVTPHIAAKTLKREMIASFVKALEVFSSNNYDSSIVVDKSKGY